MAAPKLPPDQQKTLDELKAVKKQHLPENETVCLLAILEHLGDNIDNPEWIKDNFSELVFEIEEIAHSHYVKAEEATARKAISEVFHKKYKLLGSGIHAIDLIAGDSRVLDAFFLSFAQGRKARGGKALELIIRLLFLQLGYPHKEQPDIGGSTPDFLLPGEAHFVLNPMDCIIFTVKRTLRERWRQVTTEGTKGLQFLASLDEKLTGAQLQLMLDNGIYVVVPERLKTTLYTNAPNVISFEQFFDQHLDPAMERWRKNGVIG